MLCAFFLSETDNERNIHHQFPENYLGAIAHEVIF